jgi:hypothetical protein
MSHHTLRLMAAVSVGWVISSGLAAADDAKKLPFPDVLDSSHGTKKAATIFQEFFTAKSEHDGAAMVSFFAPDPVLYIDAGLGMTWPSRAALLQVWTTGKFAVKNPAAISYPVRVVGDEHSAVIEMIDTPPLLGSEFRFLSSVTFDDKARMVRWIDYWDGRSSLVHLPIGTFGPYPSDFHDNVVNASATIQQISQALQDRFSAGDAAGATQLFTPDAVFEDMALHTRVEGQLQIQRYLTRALGSVPYGPGASLAHVVGSDAGGGYEWKAAVVASPLVRGNTALELDEDGKISRFTTIYDSFQLTTQAYLALVLLAAEQ